MATRVFKPLKKHEACYYLNFIIADKKHDLELAKADTRPQKLRDYVTKEDREWTQVEVEHWERRQAERVRRLECELESLDMAASSLTK